MSDSTVVSSCALPPQLQSWRSLVNRSITAWNELATDGREIFSRLPISTLQSLSTLDDFLSQAGIPLTFWFFQTRQAFLSQKRMNKWSRDRLDDYILLPGSKNFILRKDCFFESHFWDSPAHPDPDGGTLRLH
ncbi:hypothetical protein IFR04_010508 [Cadophora malorum]|uniref:Uncharacterized protein n=1 Tax=Cadophora malorum TaxID=108018 RepID=A0A8H7TCK9_9HELO|nr:hypothetical protein IFR04_010508 [Cadophora malorum]